MSERHGACQIPATPLANILSAFSATLNIFTPFLINTVTGFTMETQLPSAKGEKNVNIVL